MPFLDQHAYPEGGVAEAKRARRREKEAFLKTVFTANRNAVARRAAQRRKTSDAAAASAAAASTAGGKTGAPNKRPSRLRRNDSGPRKDIGSACGQQRTRAWPYGSVCMASPTQAREPGGRRRSGESGGGGTSSSTGEIKRSAADGSAGGAGAAAYDDTQQPVLVQESATDAEGTEVAGAGTNPSRGKAADKQGAEHPPEGAAKTRRGVCATGHRSDRHPDGGRQPPPAAQGQEDTDDGSGEADAETVPRAATPSPVVTSSVRVLDMGVVRPSE